MVYKFNSPDSYLIVYIVSNFIKELEKAYYGK